MFGLHAVWRWVVENIRMCVTQFLVSMDIAHKALKPEGNQCGGALPGPTKWTKGQAMWPWKQVMDEKGSFLETGHG